MLFHKIEVNQPLKTNEIQIVVKRGKYKSLTCDN